MAALPCHGNSCEILGSVGGCCCQESWVQNWPKQELSYGHGKIEALHGRLGHLEAWKLLTWDLLKILKSLKISQKVSNALQSF